MTAAPRAFVTGALGAIGRAVSDRLDALGAEVAGVDLTADPERGVVAGDISLPGDWEDHAAGAELFVHTAAIVSLGPGADRFWRVNVAGTRNALDAAVRAEARRFVHLSSVTVFGFDFPDGVDESRPVRPNGVPYVDTKVASEQVVLQAHAAGEVPCTIVRPGDVYGPGVPSWTVLPVRELRARRLLLPAMGRGIFSPVHLDDVVDGIGLAAGSAEAVGGVFTLSGGAGVETRDFFGHYARMLGRERVPVAPTPVAAGLAAAASAAARVRRAETEVNVAAVRYLARTGTYSIERARSVLGYSPSIGLDQGMESCERWLRDEGLLDS